METNFKLNLVWLYPQEMSTYGDRGNILTLKRRCQWRDIEIEVAQIDLREEVPTDWADMYFFGGGQDIAQVQVAADLKKYKKKFLQEEAAAGKVFLGICGGYQLFGHFYQDGEGNDLEGISILDVTTVASNTRMIGNLVIEPSFIKERIVGFENHSGKTKLGPKATSLGKVLVGNGNNGEDRQEGAIENNVFGCYLHGPVLPKNPQFADYLIRLALKRKYGDIELRFVNDNQEELAHSSALERAFKTK